LQTLYLGNCMYAPNTILEITWVDIWEDCSWLSESECIKEPDSECKSIGYYTGQTDRWLFISATRMEGQRNVLAIPFGVITHIRVIGD